MFTVISAWGASCRLLCGPGTGTCSQWIVGPSHGTAIDRIISVEQSQVNPTHVTQ